jgi:histidyl-tRNA synthetase
MNKQPKQQKTIANQPSMEANNLSPQPYRGARDFYPQDMKIQNYIFDTWRMVCKRYGFEEYNFPILEPFEIFAAKTGEEIVNEQMFNFTDKGGRRLAVRPELTPGTVRMLAQKYNELIQPMKWFMIGNNWRFERPQKGRGREFYQLEANIFGVESFEADFEEIALMIDIMREFGANEEQFRVSFNDRRVIDALLKSTLKLKDDVRLATRRLMDKRSKMQKEEFTADLRKLGLDDNQIEEVEAFMQSDLDSIDQVIDERILKRNVGYKNMMKLVDMLDLFDLLKYCEFDPSIVRGFDYSDGLVYEVFDLNPKNNRSMFGGERFDNLIKIFGNYDLPATGFAMGDITLREFLLNWNLLPTLPSETKVFVTVFNDTSKQNSFDLTRKLRNEGIPTVVALEDKKLDKQLKYADRKEIPYAIVLGPDEIKKGTVVLKYMKEKKQEEITVKELIKRLKI